MGKSPRQPYGVSDLLRVPDGLVDLSALDPRDTPGFGGAAKGKPSWPLGPRLSDLQERLHAEGVSGGTRSLLLVLQGMDTSARAVCSATSSARSTPRAAPSCRSRR